MKTSFEKYFSPIFEKKLLEEIQEIAIVQEIPDGEILVDIGQFVKFIPLFFPISR